MATRMQQRRDTAAQWTSTNPVLAAGELGVETDTGKAKIGDGTTVWTSLTYVAVPNAAAAADITTAINALKGGASAAWDTLVEIQNTVTSDEGVAAALAASVSSLSATVAAAVSDTAYDATSWDGDTTHAPSKNAVRDKIELLTSILSATLATTINVNAAPYNAAVYATAAAARAGTSSATAWKNAIDAAVAAGGGTIIAADGFYNVGGTLVTSRNGNALIPIPLRTPSTTRTVRVAIRSASLAGVNNYASQTDGYASGIVLVPTLSAAVTSYPAAGIPSVLGGPTKEGVGKSFTTGAGSDDFTNVHMVLEGVSVLNDSNPSISGFDLSLVAAASLRGCNVSSADSPASPVQPTRPWAWGILLPTSANHVEAPAEHCSIYNHYAGIASAEHYSGNALCIVYCYVAIVPLGGNHEVHYGAVDVERCPIGIGFVDPATGFKEATASAYGAIDFLDIEDYPGGLGNQTNWQSLKAHVYDPINRFNLAIRHGRYFPITGGATTKPLRKCGGTNVKSVQHRTLAVDQTAAATLSFTRADSPTTLPALIDPYGTSEAAQILNGTLGTISNKAYMSATAAGDSGYQAAVWDFGYCDGTLSVPVVLGGTSADITVILRALDHNNYFMVEVNRNASNTANVITLYKRIAGVFTSLSAHASLGLALGSSHTINITMSGLTFTVDIDGDLAGKGFTYTVPFVQVTGLQTQGLHGIGGNYSGDGSGGSRFGDITFTSGVG